MEAASSAPVDPPIRFTNVMADIETLALHPSNALVLSLGLTEFDPTPNNRPAIGESRLIVFDITEQILLGRLVDPKTQTFWAIQPAEASDHWRNSLSRMSVSAARDLVAQFCIGKDIWSNGLAFDISNLETLFRQGGHETPWHYRAPRDMRTLCLVNPLNSDRNAITLEDERKLLPSSFPWVDHHPITDNIKQICRVWEHWPERAELMHHPV